MLSLDKNRSGVKLETFFRSKGFQRRILADEMIFMENDLEDTLFYVVEGLVKLFIVSRDGKEKTMQILGGGQIFGETAMFNELGYCLNAQTLTDTVVYCATFKELKDAAMEEPDLAFELLRVMSDKMRTSNQQVKDMIFYDVAGRTANQILVFGQQFGTKTEQGILIQLVLTHQEIANLLGASRVTVTKILNQFEEDGVIEIVNRRILIRDAARLNEYVR